MLENKVDNILEKGFSEPLPEPESSLSPSLSSLSPTLPLFCSPFFYLIKSGRDVFCFCRRYNFKKKWWNCYLWVVSFGCVNMVCLYSDFVILCISEHSIVSHNLRPLVFMWWWHSGKLFLPLGFGDLYMIVKCALSYIFYTFACLHECASLSVWYVSSSSSLYKKWRYISI